MKCQQGGAWGAKGKLPGGRQQSAQTDDRGADFKKRVEKIPQIPDCLLNVDVLRMQQIIGNIINNSYKYADTDIVVCFHFERDFLYMRIRDFGPGVSDEELPHIFQKYYRGKDAKRKEKSGAGLGLFLGRDFMERMGGSIMAFNEKDGFSVEAAIPLV